MVDHAPGIAVKTRGTGLVWDLGMRVIDSAAADGTSLASQWKRFAARFTDNPSNARRGVRQVAFSIPLAGSCRGPAS